MSVAAAEVLRKYFRSRHALSLAAGTPSEILLVVRASAPPEEEFAFEVRGRSKGGEVVSVLVTRSEIRQAIRRGCS